MDPLSRLRTLAETLPEGGSVTLTRAALLEMLSGAGEPAGQGTATDPLADLSVTELAAERDVSESTVRGWLSENLFPNARKVRRRWLIPREDVRAAFRARPPATEEPARTEKPKELGSWRRHFNQENAA